jgi:hypothetical protein
MFSVVQLRSLHRLAVGHCCRERGFLASGNTHLLLNDIMYYVPQFYDRCVLCMVVACCFAVAYGFWMVNSVVPSGRSMARMPLGELRFSRLPFSVSIRSLVHWRPRIR